MKIEEWTNELNLTEEYMFGAAHTKANNFAESTFLPPKKLAEKVHECLKTKKTSPSED